MLQENNNVASQFRLPVKVESFLVDYCEKDYSIYGYYGFMWYQRFAMRFFQLGVPEEGVIDLIRSHIISPSFIKRYGRTSGLVPEKIADNILNIQHQQEECSSPASLMTDMEAKETDNESKEMTLEEYKKRVEESYLKRYPNASREDYRQSIMSMSDEIWEVYKQDFLPEELPGAWEAGA